MTINPSILMTRRIWPFEITKGTTFLWSAGLASRESLVHPVWSGRQVQMSWLR